MLRGVDDQGNITVNVDIAPHESTTLTWSLDHVCVDGRHVPMREVEPDASTSGDHVLALVQCDECGTRTKVDIEVATELAGLERLPALAKVARAADQGHVPPDHRFAIPHDPECGLCVALKELTDPLPGES